MTKTARIAAGGAVAHALMSTDGGLTYPASPVCLVRRTRAATCLATLSILFACHADDRTAGMGQEAAECRSEDKYYDEANVKRCTAKLASPNLNNRDRAMTLNVRGNTYDALKKYDLAIADYTEVIRLLPDFEYAYANRALERCRKGEYLAALPDYDQALKMNPNNSYARYGRGIARLRSGDATGGNSDIAEANRADPEMAGVYREIGMQP